MPMALRVSSHGHSVLAIEADAARAETIRAAGLAVGSLSEVGDSDVVVVMVATAAQLVDVLDGELGALAQMRSGATCVVMSTVGPAAVEKVAARAGELGVRVLDVPVTGGVVGAEQGTLTLLAGGDADVLDGARPVLQSMGSIFFCGTRIGDGQAVKVVNQLLCSVHLAAAAEALAFADRLGLDPERVLQAVSGGAGGSWMLADRGPRMLDDDAPALTALAIFVKDSALVAQAASDISFDAPLLRAARDKFHHAAELGHDASDDSQVRRAYDGHVPEMSIGAGYVAGMPGAGIH